MIPNDKQQMLASVRRCGKKYLPNIRYILYIFQLPGKKVIYLQKDYKLKLNAQQTTHPKTKSYLKLLPNNVKQI